MEQALLAMQGIIITLIFYLDRGRRADIALLRSDNAQLRRDMESGFKESRSEFKRDMESGFKESRSEFKRDMETGFKRIDKRLDKLTDVVMDLCRRVGRLEGRIDVAEQRPDPSQ